MFSEDEWRMFLSKWNVSRFKKSDFLTSVDEVETQLYFVIEGVQRGFFIKDGNEYTTGFSFLNSFSGIIDSFILQTPSEYYLQALTDSTLLSISYSELIQLFNHSPSFERFFRLSTEQLLCGRLKRERELLSFSAGERFRRLLRESPNAVQLIPQKYLASYLNMTPETFSRLRRKLIS